ncbi:Oidioi.mRNA.OKI2018_I69.XSR.g14475.t1.cds [Oikopleura dioica]|uniref:Oidioi.mRNA.OKI2018_I69.XSR.g14475.t1.cds n=1 Tax=Oikopleura dioica TaxID=34765 RepID=A0ABN7S9W8_OIKDI|nr:Oidioi.mRNA.OKI2018_I69.XSR.g14475.t1.cds [Oikopleura dioica]
MKIDTPIPETSKNDEKLLKIPTLLSIISEKPAISASFLFQRTEDGLKHCALNTGIPSDVYKRVLRMIMVEKCAKVTHDYKPSLIRLR